MSRQAQTRLARVGFTLTLILFFYGTLFPFRWHVGHNHIPRAWSQAKLIPFWDAERGRIHSVPDIVSNILLAIPIGFFGFLRSQRRNVWIWGAVGLAVGMAAEVLQLGIPGRTTQITDVLSQGIGGFAGAALAGTWGDELLDLIIGGVHGPAHRWLLILLAVIAVSKLGPFDLTLNVSSLRSDVRIFLDDPWELERPPRDEWNSAAQFVLLGALVGSLRRSGELPFRLGPEAGVAVLLAAPWILEGAQLLVLSHAPSLRDGAMDTAGAVAGWMLGTRCPSLLRPQAGLAIVSLGLLASGLSPYRLAPHASGFQWIPLAEYYWKTTPAALYDAEMSIVSYALFGVFLSQSRPGRRILAVAAAAGFAALIEAAQMFISGRHAGVTDVATACLGAWIGAYAARPESTDAPMGTTPGAVGPPAPTVR